MLYAANIAKPKLALCAVLIGILVCSCGGADDSIKPTSHAPATDAGTKGFTDVTDEVGLAFMHDAGV